MKCHPERWVWGLIPIAMLSWIAVDVERGRIERDLEQRTHSALMAAGFDWASIAFSGRDGLLVGTPRGSRDRDEALALARSVWGVRTVTERTRSIEQLAAVDLALDESVRISPQEVLPTARPHGAEVLSETQPSSLEAAVPAAVREPQPDAVSAYDPPAGPDAARGPGPEAVTATEPAPERKSETAAKPTDAGLAAEPAPSAEVVTAEEPPVAAAAPPAVPAAPTPEPQLSKSEPTEHVYGPVRETPTAPQEPAPGTAKVATRPLPNSISAEAEASAASEEPQPSGSAGGEVSVATAALTRKVALAAHRCRTAAEEIRLMEPIRFATGEADLKSSEREELDRLAAAANGCPGARFKVAGHADADGPARRNMTLSLRRANVVVSYLISKGIDAGRLKAVGYGETRPVAPNDTARNRAKNRRIEVEVTGLRPPE